MMPIWAIGQVRKPAPTTAIVLAASSTRWPKPAFPGGYYVIESHKTCGRPQPGLAQVVSHTVLATPSYTQLSGKACTSKGAQSPCYVVKYTHQHEIHQNFTIELN